MLLRTLAGPRISPQTSRQGREESLSLKTPLESGAGGAGVVSNLASEAAALDPPGGCPSVSEEGLWVPLPVRHTCWASVHWPLEALWDKQTKYPRNKLGPCLQLFWI